MRILIAIVFAIAAAAYCTFSISQNVADNAVALSRFDSPDAAAAYHAAAYMGTNALGLLAGWIAGYVLGWPLRRKPPAA